jgi:Na+/melibiose symporter-like transporter
VAESTLVIGLIVGIEGVIALWLPLLAGAWSDRLRTRLGGRLPFLIGASPLVLAGLAAMGAVDSVLTLAGAALIFFVGYFLAYEPYRALYPDLVDDEIAGRGQSRQAVWRGVGTGLALVGGGVLFGVSRAAPFVAAAAVAAGGMAAFTVLSIKRRQKSHRDGDPKTVHDKVRDLWKLIRAEGRLRAYLVANSLWELSLGALKTFVVLYITNGLGYSVFAAAGIVGGVALVVLIAARS